MATDDIARALAIKAAQGGGGTQVVANPTLAGTEAALEGLQVGDTKYKVGGGGLAQIGFFSCVPSASGSTAITANGTVGINCTIFASDFDDEPITLTDNDFLIITEISVPNQAVNMRSFTLTGSPYMQLDNLTSSSVNVPHEAVGIFGTVYRIR